MLAMRCKVTHGPDITRNNTRGCANKYSISIMDILMYKKERDMKMSGGEMQ